MQTLLGQLNSVPGVVGSLVCATDGAILAQAFPAAVDAASVAEAARALSETAAGLATATGEVRILDLRCANGRIVARPVAGASLLFLCSPGMNLQPLAISASVVAPKLEKLVSAHAAAPGGAAAPAPPAAGGQLWALVQQIEALIRRKRLDPFKIRGAIAMKAGFGLGFIDAETPDDPDKLSRLRAAASEVLGQRL